DAWGPNQSTPHADDGVREHGFPPGRVPGRVPGFHVPAVRERLGGFSIHKHVRHEPVCDGSVWDEFLHEPVHDEFIHDETPHVQELVHVRQFVWLGLLVDELRPERRFRGIRGTRIRGDGLRAVRRWSSGIHRSVDVVWSTGASWAAAVAAWAADVAAGGGNEGAAPAARPSFALRRYTSRRGSGESRVHRPRPGGCPCFPPPPEAV